MNTFVVDAYAWIEYFEGTSQGAKVCDIVEDESNIIITNAVTIAELASKFKRSGKDFPEARKILQSLSRVELVNGEIAEETGLLHAELRKVNKHIGMADSFVLSTARKHHAKVVTGDQDFKGMKDIVMI